MHCCTLKNNRGKHIFVIVVHAFWHVIAVKPLTRYWLLAVPDKIWHRSYQRKCTFTNCSMIRQYALIQFGNIIYYYMSKEFPWRMPTEISVIKNKPWWAVASPLVTWNWTFILCLLVCVRLGFVKEWTNRDNTLWCE